MMKKIYLIMFMFFLFSCHNNSTFNLHIDENNQPQITFQDQVIVENMIVLGEHDCLGCLEFNMNDGGMIFDENQTRHQYQLDLITQDASQVKLNITGDHDGEVYFGFSRIAGMQRGYLMNAERMIRFGSFGEFSSQLQEPVEGTFLFRLPNQFVAIKAKDSARAGNQYGMFGFMLEKLPAEVLVVIGIDSLQVISSLRDN